MPSLARTDQPTRGLPGLTVRALPPASGAEAGAVWCAVQAAAPDVPPFAGWEWTRTWLAHFGDVVPHQYLIVERAGAPVGAVLLTRSVQARGPLRSRRLHLGTAGEPDGGVFVEYNALCAPPAERAAVAQAVLAHVARLPRWDELRLDGFDPAHAASLLAAEPRFAVTERASPVLELDSPAADLVERLRSKSARATVRRSIRGISPFTTEWATTPAAARAILDDLQRLHQPRWQARGEAGAFASARFRGFHRDLVERWAPEGRAALFAVRQGEETLAALYGFVAGDTLQFYQGGHQAFEHNKVRPGYAAHLLLAAAARERGLRHYEFLVGDARYKSELSTMERTLVWATLTRRRPRAVAIRVATRLARRLRDRADMLGGTGRGG